MMMKYSAVILLAGSSRRFGGKSNKVYCQLAGKPLFMHAVSVFLKDPDCGEIIFVYNSDDKEKLSEILSSLQHADIGMTEGGKEREESVLAGAKAARFDYLLIHDGARPFIDGKLLERVKKGMLKTGAAGPGIPVTDTLREVGKKTKAINRKNLFAMQTPQGVKKNLLIDALGKLKKEDEITDDLSAIEKYTSVCPEVVLGNKNNIKVTFPDDIEFSESLLLQDVRIGFGKDIHRLEEGRKLVLGMVQIPYGKGLVGHSDADCVVHAIADAVLGALGTGDIGKFFPDDDPQYKDIDSAYFLKECKRITEEHHYAIGNIDCTIVIEEPMLMPYTDLMSERIADCLGIEKGQVNIKATRGEKLGFIGEGLGAEADCVVMLKKMN